MKKILVAATILLASLSSFAAFTGGMSEPQVKAEVIAAEQRGDSLAVIASAAFAAGIDAAFITAALIATGKDAGAVTTALVTAGFNANAVITAAVNAGANYNAMLIAAVAGGADVTRITPPTANNLGGGFNQSRASTFSGGGRSSVSPS